MLHRARISWLGASLSLWLLAPAMAQHHGHHHAPPATQSAAGTAQVLTPPSAMQDEHHHLHEQLAEALQAGGETQAAAAEVEAVLAPHFAEEDRYAMPPLSLLRTLAEGGEITAAQRQAAIEMSDKLREHYDQMIKEHQQIAAALKKLAAAAKAENKPRQLAFAEALMLHARNEEEVLYPATLLLGEYLRLTAPDQPANKEADAPAKPRAQHAH